MSYAKQTWGSGVAGGTPISAARLNFMEAGIANADFFTCTSTTRPSSPFDGQRIYETDTKAFGIYMNDGLTPGWHMYDTKWQLYTPVLSTTNYANTWTQGNGVANGRYYRKGREVSVECYLSIGSTTSYGAGASGAILVTPPTGLYPTNYMQTANSQPLSGSSHINNGGYAFGNVMVAQSVATPSQRRFVFYPFAINSPLALTGAVGAAGSWNIWASTQNLLFSCVYDTAFEA